MCLSGKAGAIFAFDAEGTGRCTLYRSVEVGVILVL
jgi:hypothetical protein